MKNEILKILVWRALGIDEIRPEMIKYMAETGTESLHPLILKAREEFMEL